MRKTDSISIHAPPRGATYLLGNGVELENISIHAPPRGATKTRTHFWRASTFQFTPLREGRRVAPFLQPLGAISIHAPPRGATAKPMATSGAFYFNSRPSARGDDGFAHHCGRSIFQFTPLREGRLRWFCPSLRAQHNFNSRPSARGDHRSEWIGDFADISIHAPPRGATCRSRRRSRPSAFQFTPLREGRPDQHHQPTSTISHFNSRPSARGDVQIRAGFLRGAISIHAPPRGAT